MKKQRQKVLVALSGGVDSSVAAALLLRQGYEVTGAFMKQWSDTTPSRSTAAHPSSCEEGIKTVCSWKKDRRDALRVAAKLGIPLITLDFEKEYRQLVMEYMFLEYKNGRTPNPDVLCNKHIKFGAWLAKARELGFDYLATGHYANIRTTKNTKVRNTNNTQTDLWVTNYALRMAKDKDKDQTYFLHQLTQAQLAHTLFPIGDYRKSEVRSLARRFNLPTAEREESMGICFVGEVPMKEFLRQKIKTKPGKIVMTSGEAVGRHDGLAFYTIGQRSGLFLSSRAKQSEAEGSRVPHRVRDPSTSFADTHSAQDDNNGPLYVVAKRIKSNELVVGHDGDPALYRKEVIAGEVSWIAGRPPAFPLQCKVRLRHRQEMQKSKVISHKSKVIVEFERPQRAVTPGQFAVFYKAGKCLGGGVI